MVSLQTLFLGVHTSNSLIRALFLPLCYILLFSPFTLAAAWYFGYVQSLQDWVSDDFSWFDILPQIALSSVFVLLPTRLLSAYEAGAKSDGGKRRVQLLPYWIPVARNLGSLVFGGKQWLNAVRSVCQCLDEKRY